MATKLNLQFSKELTREQRELAVQYAKGLKGRWWAGLETLDDGRVGFSLTRGLLPRNRRD